MDNQSTNNEQPFDGHHLNEVLTDLLWSLPKREQDVWVKYLGFLLQGLDEGLFSFYDVTTKSLRMLEKQLGRRGAEVVFDVTELDDEEVEVEVKVGEAS